ncbi:MAG: hypothetical protein Q7T07_15170 [Burkholderiaceae bacterium]|nr:hypothetical protein [Burkholderiaceae bacterium]
MPSGDHPLGLTVHSLPELHATPDGAVRTKHGRWKMLAVLLVCAAPVVASYFTYYVVRPSSISSFGELINPQRPTPPLVATTLDGQTAQLQALKGQWLLVSVAGGACDAVCQNHLYLQRQLRESLGKEKDRLDWVWLVNDDVPVLDALKPALKGATVLRLPADKLATWLEPSKGHQLPEQLYLVDPMGNWMMRFPPGFNAESAMKAKRDIERVLRASASWDNAGR